MTTSLSAHKIQADLPLNPPALASVRQRLSLYRELAKSGIVTLVLISVLGGYLIGQPLRDSFEPFRMLLTLFGVLFLASGSSALNQLQEISTDALMPRTAKRPLPSGRMSPAHAALFVGATLLLGLALLLRVSPAVAGLGLLAVISYNGCYTLWWKRSWAYAAVPGAIPGALPALIGYAAASGKTLTPGGIYLFLILFYWQMPHFWVLALRFRRDYSLGSIPTLPVARGAGITVFQIGIWSLSYIALTLMAPLFLHTGSVYAAVAIGVGAKVLWELVRFLRAFDAEAMAKDPQSSPGWLRFFLWVNFSLILYVGAAAADLWIARLFG